MKKCLSRCLKLLVFFAFRCNTNIFPVFRFSIYFFPRHTKIVDTKFPYGDMLMAFHLEKRWKKLFSSALYRSKTLHSTKVKFSQMTANDIEKFKLEVSTFGVYKLKIAQQHFIREFMRKSMMKILCHQHYAFSSLAHLLSPVSLRPRTHRKNIVKVLFNISSIKAFPIIQTFNKTGGGAGGENA